MNAIAGRLSLWARGRGRWRNNLIEPILAWDIVWPRDKAAAARRRQVAYCRAWQPGEVALRVLAAHMVEATAWWDREEWTKHSDLSDQ